ncbi:MAG TPA: hypothetical protein VMV31_12515 [Terriglobales bacterium]|nr:hypothetical protein [Terriglobales bacterium]
MMPAPRRFLPALAAALFLVSVAAAQQPKPEPLNHDQQLQIENYAKDVKLAQQQIELLKVQLAAALLGERRSEQNFAGYMAQLRTDLKAPADRFDFDAATLSFVPKGSKAAAAQPTPTALKPPAKAPARAAAKQ